MSVDLKSEGAAMDIATKKGRRGRKDIDRIIVEKGKNGFGYDPIFYVPEFGKTTAELTEEEKNQVSHRGKALQLMGRITEICI